jgi:hypothetical protein
MRATKTPNPHVVVLIEAMGTCMRGEQLPEPGSAGFDRIANAMHAFATQAFDGQKAIDCIDFGKASLDLLIAQLTSKAASSNAVYIAKG